MIVTVPTLVGQRVTLRPYSAGFSDEELAKIYRWANDPEILRLAGGVPTEVSFERFKELFSAQLAGHNSEREQLFLILDEHGQAIGRAGLFGLGTHRAPRSAELGIVIGEHAAWGQGYGREAVRLLLDFGFRQLDLELIRLYTYPHNVRARRAFEAAGFRVVRQIKRFSLERGSHAELEMEVRPPRRPHG